LRCGIGWLFLDRARGGVSSIPLYRAVKQEFIPTNVDEAELK